MIELAKPSREEFRLQAEEYDRQLREAFGEKLEAAHDVLDEDGYPTDYALDLIEMWHWSNPKGWFDFINSIWHLKGWGWNESEIIDEVSGKEVHSYDISTAGWSGNESIIKAMERNGMMWHLNWVQSRRGGHYIFQLRDIAE